MDRILVTGGIYQGKTKWVKDNFPDYKYIYTQDIISGQLLNKNEFFHNLSRCQPGFFINKFHLLVRHWLDTEEDYNYYTELIIKNPSWVIASDDIGKGIVPVEKKERAWREATGRILCRAAECASKVYVINSGIPIKIKG